MIDENKRAQDFAAKEKERRRMRVTVDPANYEYKAEQAPIDFYDKSVIYGRRPLSSSSRNTIWITSKNGRTGRCTPCMPMREFLELH